MKPYLLALLSGIALGAPFVVPMLWPLELVGLAPLLIALAEKPRPRRAFALGFVAGVALYGFALGPIFWSALPLDWLSPMSVSLQFSLVTLNWIFESLCLALLAGLFGLFFSRLSGNAWKNIAVASALWVINEWMAAWWMVIVNYGQGSVISPDFTLAYIGYPLAHDQALVQLAWLGGVYLLSAVAAGAGALTSRLILVPRERRVLIFTTVALAVVWAVGYFVVARIPATDGISPTIAVAAVATQQGAVFVPTGAQDVSNFNDIAALFPQAASSNIVVLPEGSDFLRTLNTTDQGGYVWLSHALATTTLIDSATIIAENDHLRSQVEFYKTDDGSYEVGYKRFLLPDGEYISYLLRSLMLLAGQGELVRSLETHRGFLPGSEPIPHLAGGYMAGVLFCDEAMSPELYRSLAQQGAGFFINIASHAWFHGSPAVADQMRDIGIVRAVESRRWYVEANDVSPAYILDPYGRTATSSPWGSTALVKASIQVRDDMTPYVRFGPWVVYAALIFILLITLARVRTHAIIKR